MPDAKPKPRARWDTASCSMQNYLFIAGDLHTGNIRLSRSHYTTAELNSFQFANFVSQNAGVSSDGSSAKRFTAARVS